MLYQLAGPQYLQAGMKVDMGTNGYERWGVVIKVIEIDYKFPNKCMVSGTIRYMGEPVNLFLIRGGNYNPTNELQPTVWSFSS